MATTKCCSTTASARRLSDLLEEQQQEPLLLLHLLLQDHDDDDESAATPAAARRSLLRGSTTVVTKLALRWADDLLAGCLSFPCAATRLQQRFRRLQPRADRVRDVAAPATECHHRAGDCRRQQQQLSPVSVLDLLHSDDDDDSSPVPSSHRDDEHSDDDVNGKPSTSGTGTSSPSAPSINHHDIPGNTPAVELERFQRKSIASAWDWETDMSSIPTLVEPDLSASPRDDWRRLVVGVGGGEEEARLVARSIEAMIFEEVRWETVRDMLCSPQH